MGVRIQVVDAGTTSELRRAVLRPHWPVGSRMHGDDDPDALHVAAIDDDGRIVGAAVLLPLPYPHRPERANAWQLRGMATAAGRRGEGIGAAVLAEALHEAQGRGAELVWCQARDVAIDFYTRHGFVGEGAHFTHEETGIVHQLMYRELFGVPDSSL